MPAAVLSVVAVFADAALAARAAAIVSAIVIPPVFEGVAVVVAAGGVYLYVELPGATTP